MTQPARAEPFRTWPAEAQALLTLDDLVAVRAVLAELAPGWSAELNQSGPDDSTIVVLPEGANDLLGPAFVLHRGEGRVQLDQFRWDEYRALGGFRSLDHALAALRSRLLVFVAQSRPVGGAADGGRSEPFDPPEFGDGR